MEKKSIHCGADKWTIESLQSSFLNIQQQDTSLEGQLPTQIPVATPEGQKEPPIWSFIPVNKMLSPLLHYLIGLGNDLVENFFTWLDIRVEKLTPEEIQARNMYLLAAIAVDAAEEELEEKKHDLTQVVQVRIGINASLKRRRDLTPEQLAELNTQKRDISEQEVAAREGKNTAESKVKVAKSAKEQSKKVEAALRKSIGKKDKTVRAWIEHEIFVLFKVSFSKYHGGDMEGPSIRIIMQRGPEIFGEIASYLKTVRIVEGEGGLMEVEEEQAVLPITEEEIDETCENHGRMGLLLDSVLSKLNSRRGSVTPALIAELETELQHVMMEWDRMGLSLTPKMHCTIDHAAEQMQETGGHVDMTEDAIERSHQTRFADEHRLSRLRNHDMVKKSQAKFQNTRMLAPVKAIQKEVLDSSKRVMKRESALADERNESKKAKRTEKRRDAMLSVAEQDMTLKVMKPQETVKLGLKQRVQEQSNEEKEET
jgi:hypothetical protein